VKRNTKLKQQVTNVLGHAMAHQSRSADKSDVLHVCLWCVVKGTAILEDRAGRGCRLCIFKSLLEVSSCWSAACETKSVADGG
jgi:hypothetical protein